MRVWGLMVFEDSNNGVFVVLLFNGINDEIVLKIWKFLYICEGGFILLIWFLEKEFNVLVVYLFCG